MKRYIKSSTAYKRIARTDEFDNGHILHGDWKKMSDEEAEELAKQASIENPGKIYYVQYDDLMNAASDIKWVNGESYNTYKDALDASRGRAERYIKSDSGFGKDFDVFMLMRYIPDSGENGMAGDRFYCEGKFFASNLSEAEAEFKALQQKYPRLKNYYVDDYNEEFDTADWRQPPSNPMDPDYNVFADLETLVHYYGLDGQGSENYSEGLPFEI